MSVSLNVVTGIVSGVGRPLINVLRIIHRRRRHVTQLFRRLVNRILLVRVTRVRVLSEQRVSALCRPILPQRGIPHEIKVFVGQGSTLLTVLFRCGRNLVLVLQYVFQRARDLCGVHTSAVEAGVGRERVACIMVRGRRGEDWYVRGGRPLQTFQSSARRTPVMGRRRSDCGRRRRVLPGNLPINGHCNVARTAAVTSQIHRHRRGHW